MKKALKIEDEGDVVPSYTLEGENDFNGDFHAVKTLFRLTSKASAATIPAKQSKTEWENVKSGSDALNFLTGVLVVATLLIVISNM